MSHHKYKTEGFILGGFNIGESNRYLYVFTRELGLVGASAQGVRELKSKPRYSLQNFSYSNPSTCHVDGFLGLKQKVLVKIEGSPTSFNLPSISFSTE